MASQVGVFARNELPVTVSSPRLVNETRRLPQGSSNFLPTFLDSILVNSTTANRTEAFSEAQSHVLPSNFGSKDPQYYQSREQIIIAFITRAQSSRSEQEESRH